MKPTVKLSKDEMAWLTTFDDNFHTALTKIKMGCVEFKDVVAQLEKIDKQLEKQNSNL